GNSDAFTALHIKRVAVGISRAVNRPNVIRHVSAKRRREGSINGTIGKRTESLESLFLSIVERRRRDRSFARELRYSCTLCNQNDAAKQVRPFTWREDWIGALF